MRIIRNMAGGGPSASAEADEAGCGAPAAGCDDVRCGCGSLLARVVGGEVELKCRRCKQVWRLALPAPGAGSGPARWRLLEGAGR
jgi:hypothetical protein